MDDVWPDLPAQGEEMDYESTDVPNLRIYSTDVKHPTQFWHDEYDVVHLVRTINPNYTMCHKMTVVVVVHKVKVTGYTDDTPNCLLCMVIER